MKAVWVLKNIRWAPVLIEAEQIVRGVYRISRDIPPEPFSPMVRCND